MSLGLYTYNLIVVDVFKIFPTTGYTSRYFITKKKKNQNLLCPVYATIIMKNCIL
jgi:hypothetical protein